MRITAIWALLITALTLLVFVGCEPIIIQSSPCRDCVPVDNQPCPYPTVPPLDLPEALRQRNYASGSCVHAAMIDVLRWQNKNDLATWWRKNQRGGAGLGDLTRAANKAGLDFAYTGNGNAGFLEWCSRTRRGAVLFFYSNHCVTFCGFNRGDAVLLNNNNVSRLVRIPKRAFIQRWRSYGGVGFTPVGSPSPPRPWVPIARAM